MTDDLEDAIRRGQRAALILADPLVQEALNGIEANLMAAWRGSPVRDAEGREAIWAQMRAMDAFRNAFAGWIADGRFAEAEVEARNAEKKVNGIPG